MPTLEATLAQTTPIMSCKLQLCVILQGLLGKRGVDWMSARRTKVHYKQIHVSIPVRLLEDFDELLSFKASRSKAISHLMRKHIDGSYDDTPMMTSRQLMAMLTNRDDVDDLLKTLLLQILSQSS